METPNENSQPSSQPKSKKRRLTQREKKLLLCLSKGMTFREAGIKAGYTANSPAQSAHNSLRNIEKKAPDLFERHGLGDDAFIKLHLLPALRAKETKFFAHEGVVKDQREVIAWGPRTAMIALTARLKGMISDSGEGGNTSIKILLINGQHRPAGMAVTVSTPHVPGLSDANTRS